MCSFARFYAHRSQETVLSCQNSIPNAPSPRQRRACSAQYSKLQAISVTLKAFRTFHFSFPNTRSLMIDFLSDFHSDHHHNHPATESAQAVAELASLDYQVFGQRQRAFLVLGSLARLSFSSSCCRVRVRYTS